MKKTTINNLSDPMNIAFMEAKKAFNKNEVPVGAVVTDINGDILAKAYNLVESKQDPTAHAEILAIKKATIILKNKYLMKILYYFHTPHHSNQNYVQNYNCLNCLIK